MRVAIMGAGGIGGFFGAKLAQGGADVIFVARGPHLDAIRKNGLRLRENDHLTLIRPANALEDTSAAEPVDVILFAVKLGDTDAALQSCLPMMHEDTFIVTLQNGVESVGMIERIVGPGRTLGGSVYVVASILEPGIISKTGPSERMEIAEPNGGRSARALAFERLCRDAGIDIHLMDDMDAMLWRKFILLSGSSAITALTRQPMGFAQKDPVAQEVVQAAVGETVALARARGIDLAGNIEEVVLQALNFVVHGEAKSSQLIDLERGKPLELEWLSGAIHRMGKAGGVPTPVHSTTYAALRPFAGGKQ